MQEESLCMSFMACACLTFFILIIGGFSSLEVNELGLDYSSISKTVDDKPFTAGYHFLGLGHSFIKYPKTVQQFEFSEDRHADYTTLHSRTSDGLEVKLEISFQYRLQPDHIYDVFINFKDDYKKIFKNIAIDILTNNATSYVAYQFFVDRQQIGTAMQIALDQHFKENCFANIEFFQLRSVDLPDRFEESIQLTEVSKQNIQKAEAEKDKVLVELETLEKKAEYQKNVTQNIAEGDAIEEITHGKATAKSFLVKQSAKAKSYSVLKKQLDMNNDDLVEYVKDKVVRDYDQSDIIIALDGIKKSEVKHET